MDTIEDGENDKDLLSSALNDEPQATPAPAEAPLAEAESGQPRDDQGRFAPKGETAPQPPPQRTQPQADAATQPPLTADSQPQDHRVPLRELLDEREKRQEAARQLAERDQRLEYMSRLLAGMQQQPQQQPGQQPQQPADIWSDPDAYLNARLQPLVQRAEQRIQDVLESTSRIAASEKYGEEVVNTAYAELARQMQSGQGQFDYQRIMASQHPFGELVKWHKAQTNMRQVGEDPNAWLEKQLEAKMNDPAFQAEVIRRAQGQQQQPSNGSGRPAPISLPPSLRSVPSAMGVVDDDNTDESDAALLSSALRRR